MKKTLLLLVGMIISTPLAFSHGDEGHHMDGHMAHNPCSMQAMEGMNPCNMPSMKKGGFLKKKIIDGYDVSFHIMKAPEGMEHGGTHHIMIKVEQNNKIIALQAVNSKVTHPNNKSESKMMMKMGDWYMASYNLAHDGEHQVMVLFKTEGGKKHFGGIQYIAKP
ncbi:MAG: hypothetical protein R8K49_09495 [Mariprofundaceae bacterium]